MAALIKWQSLSLYNDRACICNASQGLIMFSNGDKELKTLALEEPDADGQIPTRDVDQSRFGEIVPLSIDACLEKDIVAGADNYGVEFLSMSTSELQPFTIGELSDVIHVEFDPSGELLLVVTARQTMVYYGAEYVKKCEVAQTGLSAWASFSPKDRHYRSTGGCTLACLDQDGNVTVFRDVIEANDKIAFKKISSLNNAITKESARKINSANISWDKSGSYFVLPAGQSVLIVSVNASELKSRYLTRFEKPSLNQESNVCKVATGMLDGRNIVIGLYDDGHCFGWDVESRVPVLISRDVVSDPASSIWNMIWSERKVNDVIFEPVLMLTSSVGCLGSIRLTASMFSSQMTTAVSAPVIAVQDDDDDDRVVIRRDKRKKTNVETISKSVRFADVDNDAAAAPISLEEKESVTDNDKKNKKKKIAMEDDDDEFKDDFDLVVEEQQLDTKQDEDDIIEPLVVTEPPMTAMIPQTSPQDPFQSSSSEFVDNRRYLCWNEFGAVVLYQEDSYNTIEIEFTEATQGRNIRLTDHYGYTLGWLGQEGIFLSTPASDGDEEKGEEKNMLTRIEQEEERRSRARGSIIYFKAFSSLSTTGEWSLTLPIGEEVVCMTCGAGWSAVATNKGYCRIFTTGGFQDEVFWCPGPVVALAGRGRYLAVFYHSSVPVLETQSVSCRWIDLVSRQCICDVSVGCSPSSELTWVGITDRNHLCTMNDAGILSVLVNSCGWSWVPALEVELVRKQSSDDHYWPIAVRGDTLTCILLKGSREVPETFPRPVTCALPFEVPLIYTKNTPKDVKDLMTASVTQSTILSMIQFDRDVAMQDGDSFTAGERSAELEAMELNVDKSLLRLFQKYCELPDKRLLDRAQDVASKLHSVKSLDVALKICHHCGLNGLAQRVNEIRRMKAVPVVAERPVIEEEEEEEEEVVPVKRRLTFEDNEAQKTLASNLSPVIHQEQDDGMDMIVGERKRPKLNKMDEEPVVAESRQNLLSNKVDKLKKQMDSRMITDKFAVPLSPVRESNMRNIGSSQATSPFSALSSIKRMQESPKKTVLSKQSSFSSSSRARAKQDKHLLS